MLSKHDAIYLERLKAYYTHLHRLYGFVSDKAKTKKDNFNNALKTILKYDNNTPQSNKNGSLPSRQPINLAVHNLCHSSRQPPPGTKNLLGLGLKYCIVPPKATPDIKTSMLKLAYKIRTKNHLITTGKTNANEYIPQLYIKLKNWNPPPAPLSTEERMTLFEKKIKEASRINNL